MSDRAAREPVRVEAFSDSVFAVAITLLSLGLVTPAHDHERLLATLLSAWPKYLAFFTSFVTVGIMWINHHRLFTHIQRVSHALLLWNGLLLMSVTLIPLTSRLVAEHIGRADSKTAAVVYSAGFVFTTLSFNLLWRHAASDHRLLDRHVTPLMVRRINLQYGFGPLLYLASLAIALASGLASVIIDCALAVYFALPAYTIADASPLVRDTSPARS